MAMMPEPSTPPSTATPPYSATPSIPTDTPVPPRVSARRVLGEGALVGVIFGACVGGLMVWSVGNHSQFGGVLPQLLELCSKTMLAGAIIMTVYAALLLLIERRVGKARHAPLSRAAFRVWLGLPLICAVLASLYAHFVMVYRPREAIDFSGAGLIGGGLLLALVFAAQRLLPPRVVTPVVSKRPGSPWDEEES